MIQKEKIVKKVEEIREMLSKKPQGSFPCSTSEIQYFDHLGKECLKKYEELYSLKAFDIRQKKLLEYLKESLTKMPREEAEYNRQSALLACQEILKREEKK